MHPHTTKTYTDASGEERPLMVGDVAKVSTPRSRRYCVVLRTSHQRSLALQVGYCIECPSDVFSSIYTLQNNETDHQAFYDDCLVDAFEEVTVNNTAVWQIKTSYSCDVDSRDFRYFQALLSGY